MAEEDPTMDPEQDSEYDPTPYETIADNPTGRYSGVEAGELDGQATISEGRSTTRGEADASERAALDAGVSQEDIDRFLSENPGDYERLLSAFDQEPSEDDGGGDDRQNFSGGGGQGNPGYGFPGGPGVFRGPVQQVGDDPFSQAIMGGYMDLLGNQGRTQLGSDLNATLRGLLERRGGVDANPGERAMRLEAARQPIEAMRKAQTSSLRNNLASRNLLSLPGIQQGPEANAYGRMEEALAPYYATAGQNVALHDFDAQNDRLSQTLNLATSQANQEAQQYRGVLESAGGRQNMLSQIALGTLDRNIAWNKFLAELGLNRDQIKYQIQKGQVDSLTPLLQLFQQYAQTAAGGYI